MVPCVVVGYSSQSHSKLDKAVKKKKVNFLKYQRFGCTSVRRRICY